MPHRTWLAALGLVLSAALPAHAQILEGKLLVRGAEMS
jgi:hypothetical protein